MEKISENRIILESDVLGIMTQFAHSMTCACHPLLQDARLRIVTYLKFMFEICRK